MKLALCTLVLNEIEWLEKLYLQHKDWPDLVQWVFVESADRVYAETNPQLVSSEGLSVDGTTEFIERLVREDDRIVHIKHGISLHQDPAQGKCDSRNRYLEAMEPVRPDFFIVLDADEFYPRSFQGEILEQMKKTRRCTAFLHKHRDIWRPASISNEPLFKYEVSGGFWDIPYCRGWRWFPNLGYRVNHNTPDLNRVGLDKNMYRFDQLKNSPEFIHMGFACDPVIRASKNRYYENRGESKDPKRYWYTESRKAFETWKPGDKLPRGAKVVLYDGEVPECFKGV